ncbi:MAG: branched-chain amino acid ABC transporter permease [Leptolinea sp.]
MFESILQAIITGVLIGVIYALITLGLSVIFGTMNVVNFAHGDFVMLSMYLSYAIGMFLLWDAVATPLITVPLLFAFGYFIYYLLIDRTLRQSFVVQLAVTVGLSILMRSLALMIWKGQSVAFQSSIITGNFEIGGITILTSRLVSAIVSILFIIALTYFLNKTWAGAAMRAASDDLDAASLMGVNYHRTYALTFAIGSAITAVAGGLLMTFQQTDALGGMRFGTLSWCILSLAGWGSIPGLLISGVIVGVAESLAITYIDPRSGLVAVYLIFILVLWLRPRGLFGRKF